MMAQQIARAKIERSIDEFYGLPIYVINDQEYGTAFGDEQADQAAREFVKDCLDHVDASLILKHANLPPKVMPLIQYMQGGCWEESRILKSIIDDVDALTKEALEFHGRAYFLGFFNNQIELSLIQFPKWCIEFILADSGESNPQQVYLYKL